MKNENYRDKIESALLEAPTYVTSNIFMYMGAKCNRLEGKSVKSKWLYQTHAYLVKAKV